MFLWQQFRLVDFCTRKLGQQPDEISWVKVLVDEQGAYDPELLDQVWPWLQHQRTEHESKKLGAVVERWAKNTSAKFVQRVDAGTYSRNSLKYRDPVMISTHVDVPTPSSASRPLLRQSTASPPPGNHPTHDRAVLSRGTQAGLTDGEPCPSNVLPDQPTSSTAKQHQQEPAKLSPLSPTPSPPPSRQWPKKALRDSAYTWPFKDNTTSPSGDDCQETNPPHERALRSPIDTVSTPPKHAHEEMLTHGGDTPRKTFGDQDSQTQQYAQSTNSEGLSQSARRLHPSLTTGPYTATAVHGQQYMPPPPGHAMQPFQSSFHSPAAMQTPAFVPLHATHPGLQWSPTDQRNPAAMYDQQHMSPPPGYFAQSPAHSTSQSPSKMQLPPHGLQPPTTPYSRSPAATMRRAQQVSVPTTPTRGSQSTSYRQPMTPEQQAAMDAKHDVS